MLSLVVAALWAVMSGQPRAELAGQKERLEARLAQLKRSIGRLARSEGDGGAVTAELGKINEGYVEVQDRVEEAKRAMEAFGCGGPTEDADGRVEPGKDGQTVDVRVPMEFKVRGGRKEIILPADAGPEPKAQPVGSDMFEMS